MKGRIDQRLMDCSEGAVMLITGQDVYRYFIQKRWSWTAITVHTLR